ncbi:MAG: acetyl-CoA decarbonylase/synthase complex subunit gamma [Acidobacteria bacterium]|nr:acetyl-CoA decarbonylase/synthase complex subunit gamma [Acidobacteriota bacterium]
MPLTGLQIFKLLPNTNCRECGVPTCLAFAMKLAAGKESLDKCPYASEQAKAALGAASAPPIRGVTIGRGERAITVGEETVFFRHEKTFVRRPGLFQVLGTQGLDESWLSTRIERAGETFQVDGVAVVEAPAAPELCAAAAERGFPVAVLASTPEGAAAMAERIRDHRPLLVPPAGTNSAAYVSLAARLGIPLVVSGIDLAVEAARCGVADLLLEPPGDNPQSLHHSLTAIRRGALDRIHPGLGYPVFLRAGKFETAVLGISKFASVLAIEKPGIETWLPLWTLRQNIYTDPQKPLQMDAGVYPIGEPDDKSPLLVTTNFSLTYFVVSSELESAGLASHLAVVEAEGLSVLTAWSAGKFSGDRVAKALRAMRATERVSHRTVIIPGYVSIISGELEDALNEGWRVLVGPQEASDLAPYFRDVWDAVRAE